MKQNKKKHDAGKLFSFCYTYLAEYPSWAFKLSFYGSLKKFLSNVTDC